jgi:hypothetical protein
MGSNSGTKVLGIRLVISEPVTKKLSQMLICEYCMNVQHNIIHHGIQ